jgi:glycosyltransferase involved in cell wall biosynthesis
MRRTIRQLVFASDAPRFGGAEQYVISMAQAARRRGIESLILWMPRETGDAGAFDLARDSGIRLEIIPPSSTRSLRGLTREFGNALGRQRPDGLIINACGRPRFWMLPWLAQRAGVPAAWVHHMVDACDHRRLPATRFGGRMEGLQCWRLPQMIRHRLAGAGATAVVALNAEDRKRIVRWQGVRRDKIFAVPPGVDCHRYQFDPTGRERWLREWGIEASSRRPFIVGTAGRLSHEKGIDLLIEAVAIARRGGLELLAVIAGQGDRYDELLRLAESRGVSGAVRFVSFVEDMPAFHSALDAFVSCSRTESFGLGLAEAMACRRVVVATPTSGSTRQIDHLHNGWQLRSFEPAELAGALAAMAADPERCEQMGNNGRESVMRQFSIDLTLERTLRALRGTARERSGLCWPGMNEPPFAGMTAEDCA